MDDGADLWDIDDDKKADLAGNSLNQEIGSAELDSSLDFKMTFNAKNDEP